MSSAAAEWRAPSRFRARSASCRCSTMSASRRSTAPAALSRGARRDAAPPRRSTRSACPAIRRPAPMASATQPKLLLADESLGGLDAAEMERAAAMLGDIRQRLGITIVWVEHIMGVLMRVVDRVIVLDHGEMIFEGKPADAARDPRVTEVYLGHKRR